MTQFRGATVYPFTGINYQIQVGASRPDRDAAAPRAGLEPASASPAPRPASSPSRRLQVHVADHLRMGLGDGVERTVAQAHHAVVVLERLVAARAQKPREVGRVRRLGGDLAAERVGGGAQRAPRLAVLVVRRGVGEQPRGEAVVARREADRHLARRAVVELRGPSGARAAAARPARVGDRQQAVRRQPVEVVAASVRPMPSAAATSSRPTGRAWLHT